MADPPQNHEPLPLEIHAQPDDATCGPTCLHAVYRFFGDEIPFDELLAQVRTLEEGGTLGVLLADHALSRGYGVTVVTWNLRVFDPTWFEPPRTDLAELLRKRASAKQDTKLRFAARAYARFVEHGGQVEFADLGPGLLSRFLRRGLPILTGLSATFLYRESREDPTTNKPDDVGGEPAGHFTVLTGYDSAHRQVYVCDPLYPNVLSQNHTYPLGMERVVGAIYLGVLTYDANLVIIEPAPE